ncbi:MAG: HAD family hydrolase [Armatimonadota bacterium]
MAMVRLLILDVEGVIALPGGSQHPWPLETMLRLRSVLAAAPYACGLCTGRQEPYGEAIVQALSLFRPLPDDVRKRVRAAGGPPLVSWPSILENGAYFYDPVAKTPYAHPALTPEWIETIQRVRAEAIQPLVRETGALLEAGKDFSLSLNPPLLDPGTGERQSTAEFRPRVEAAVAPLADVVEVKHSLSAIDITPRGVSKASAVRLLLEWTGLAPEEVLGVGDTAADEAWLQVVGHRAAPANGRPFLRDLHYYADAEVVEGLLQILQRLEGNGYAGL